MPKNKSLIHLIRSFLIVTLCVGLIACHDEEEPAYLQVVHLSPDAPNIEILDDGFQFADELPFASSTGRVDLGDGNHDVLARAILPNGSRPTAFSLTDLDFAADTDNIVFAINEFANIEPYVIVRDNEDIPSDMTRVRVAHLAHDAPMVDIYLTEPDADLASSTPTITQQFKDAAFVATVAAGDYQVRITPAGEQSVIYDSETLPLAGGNDITLLAVKNTRLGDSPVELALVSGSSVSILSSVETPANIRWIHASADTAGLDIVLDDVNDPAQVSDLNYKDVTDSTEFVPDTYNINLFDTGTTNPALENFDISLARNTSYSQYILDTNSDLQTLTVVRNPRRIATTARLDVVHAAPAAGTVDVYINPTGTDITDLEPSYNNFPFDLGTNFVAYAPGTYDLVITDDEDKTNILLEVNNVQLAAGGIYTAVAIDQQRTAADPDGLPIELLLLDDFVATQ